MMSENLSRSLINKDKYFWCRENWKNFLNLCNRKNELLRKAEVFIFNFYFMCMSTMPACAYVQQVCAQCPWRSQGGTRSLKLECGCWELNPRLLQGQHMLLTAEHLSSPSNWSLHRRRSCCSHSGCQPAALAPYARVECSNVSQSCNHQRIDPFLTTQKGPCLVLQLKRSWV